MKNLFKIFSIVVFCFTLYTQNNYAQQNAITQTKESQNSMTPADALKMLKEGNSRFVSSSEVSRNLMQQVKQTSAGQYPFAMILSCVDSRTSSELIFDQGIGDIFNARIAGNIIDEDVLGSMEFACKVTGAKLIVVLGHTNCGR